MGRPGRIVEDPAHAGLGSIGGAEHGGFLRDDFGDASGAVTQASGESSEGVEAVTHKTVNSHTVRSGFVLCPLQGAEQSGGARDGDRNESQAAQDTGPLLGADAAESGQFFEDFRKGFLAVRWQLDGVSYGVHDPS